MRGRSQDHRLRACQAADRWPRRWPDSERRRCRHAGLLAPEQAAGHQRQVGPAVDVYALGAILYECLTGRPPFQATALETLLQVRRDEPVSIGSLQPRVPRDLATIAMRAWKSCRPGATPRPRPCRRPRAASSPAADPCPPRRAVQAQLALVQAQPGRGRPLGARVPCPSGRDRGLDLLRLESRRRGRDSEGARQAECGSDAPDSRLTNRGSEQRRTAEENATQEAIAAGRRKRALDMEAARLKFSDAIGHALGGLAWTWDSLDSSSAAAGARHVGRTRPRSAGPLTRRASPSGAGVLPTLRYVLEDQDFQHRVLGGARFAPSATMENIS